VNPRRDLLAGALALSLCTAARAERSAVSLDIGSGVALISVRAPYAQGAPSQTGTSFVTSLGFRYALTNTLELGAAAFYEPPSTFTHADAHVPSPGGLLPGTLSERTQQFGLLARGRFVQGFTWRFVAGADVGFAIRSFSNVDHYDVSDPSTGPRSYGLNLADTSQKALLVAPSAGVEWTGDRFTIGLVPRVEVLFGNPRTWAVSLPLTLSWSWYL
jgi:hypothetical protein